MSRQQFGNRPWSQSPHGSQFTRPPSRSPAPKDRSRSGSPGVFSKIGLGASLHVTLAEELLFLHPTDEGNDVPTEDPWVSGTVTLWLPKARKVKDLTVKLTGQQNIGFPPESGRHYESSTILEKEVSLVTDDKDVLLEKGEHSFAFSIIVPSSTATYERCQYGRIKHTVTATAKGLGSMGGDLVEEKALFLVVNPGGAGHSIPAPPLELKVEGMLEEIGPYTVALQSQYCVVGGLLLMRFNLPVAANDLIIYSFKIKANQYFTLRSPQDPSFTYKAAVDARTIFVIDANHPPNFGLVEGPPTPGVRSGSQTPHSGPLKVLNKGQDYKIYHLARFPNDNIMRPSTQQGTDTGIHVRHDIVLEMTYKVGHEEKRKEKGKEKEHTKDRRKLTVSKPLDIFSCCCFVDSLTLPVYSILDPNPEPERDSPPCVCGHTTGALIKYHGGNLLREEGEGGITYAPVYKSDSGSSTPLSTDGSRGRSGVGGREVFLRTNSGNSYFDT